MTIPCLSVENASFQYDADRLLFHNLSFQLYPGEILTILGPNGAGKSTLLDCISGIRKLLSGNIKIDDTDLSQYSRKTLAKKISYVPQNHTQTYEFTVREYVAMGRAPYISVWSSPSEKDYQLVDNALAQLGITRLADKIYTQLSGGECQQVMIARSLVQQAKIIIFDEPTNHLDYGNQLKVLRQIKHLAQDGYSLIWTTHVPDHALMLNSKVAILERNGVWKTGLASELITENQISQLYDAKICQTYVEKAEREACIPYRL